MAQFLWLRIRKQGKMPLQLAAAQGLYVHPCWQECASNSMLIPIMSPETSAERSFAPPHTIKSKTTMYNSSTVMQLYTSTVPFSFQLTFIFLFNAKRFSSWKITGFVKFLFPSFSFRFHSFLISSLIFTIVFRDFKNMIWTPCLSTKSRIAGTHNSALFAAGELFRANGSGNPENTGSLARELILASTGVSLEAVASPLQSAYNVAWSQRPIENGI